MDFCSPDYIGPYELRGEIGSGSFSVVRVAYLQDTNEYFACKMVSKSHLVRFNLYDRFEAEIRIFQQIHHPGVVELHDILSDQNFFYLIIEFCPGGELFRYIVDQRRLDEREAGNAVREILNALEYVHNLGICHRDLKPENILIDQFGHVKISDFGLSRFVGFGGMVDTPCGSPCYASPECISGKSYDGRKSDVWSVGVITFAMLTGQLPWTKRNQSQLFEQIKKGDYLCPSYLTEQCKSFISGLMCVDCNRRMTISQALQHPWLQEVRKTIFGAEKIAGGPSLRRLDRFFSKEVTTSSLDLLGFDGSGSMKNFSLTKAVRLIKPRANNRTIVLRRRITDSSTISSDILSQALLISTTY